MGRSVWLTNHTVAWEIPPGRIARNFMDGIYLPPEGWQVSYSSRFNGWLRGKYGELRKEVSIHEHE